MQKNSFLLDALPKTVWIGGTEFAIETDYRAALRFTRLMQEPAPDWIKMDIALQIFFGDAPVENVPEAARAMMDFYRGGKPESQTETKNAKRTYDFAWDAEYIYAAFLQQYGIDLQSVSYLHWWKFRALFAGLSEDTQIMKIMGYRAIEITSAMPKEQKRRYQRLKQMYALPDNRTEEEKERDFAAALLNL